MMKKKNTRYSQTYTCEIHCKSPTKIVLNRHSAEYYWIRQRRFHAREKMLIWVNREIIYTQETQELPLVKFSFLSKIIRSAKSSPEPNFAVISAK